MNNFDKERKKFESAEKRTLQMEMNYVINQINNLYDLINKNSNIETNEVSSKTAKKKKTTTKKKTTKKDAVEDKPVEAYIIEEFKSWGIDENSSACKFLLDLEEPVITNKIKSGMTINDIALVMGKNPRVIKTALTNLRKKADFSNPAYCKKLKVMKTEDITNEVIIGQIIEFFL